MTDGESGDVIWEAVIDRGRWRRSGSKGEITEERITGNNRKSQREENPRAADSSPPMNRAEDVGRSATLVMYILYNV